MIITKPLNEIMKKRNLTLVDLYKKINGEIRIVRLSDIRVARVTPTKEEIKILALYLDLTDEEIEDLEDMKIDKILLENAEKINNLMSLVPKDLKAGQEVIKECPNKTQVNHKNGIKSDNRLENLEVVTPQENIIHSITTGLKKNFKTSNHNGENNPNRKLTEKEVLDIMNYKLNGLHIKYVYEKYKDKISYKGLEQVWYRYNWKDI